MSDVVFWAIVGMLVAYMGGYEHGHRMTVRDHRNRRVCFAGGGLSTPDPFERLNSDRPADDERHSDQ